MKNKPRTQTEEDALKRVKRVFSGRIPEGRAATPEEKRAVVEMILQAWLTCPSLRLGQLIMNVLGDEQPSKDPYNIEDFPLAQECLKYMKR